MKTLTPIELQDARLAHISGLNTSLAVKNHLLPISLNGENRLVSTKEHLATALCFAGFYSLGEIVCVVDAPIFEELQSGLFDGLREDVSVSQDIIDENEYFAALDDDILADENAAPVIRFVNSIFYEASKQRASDIHIESKENGGSVRFRVDGVLSSFLEMKPSITKAVIGRIKVISNLDISEKRVPQDGRINLIVQRKKLDVRVSTIPTFYGEKAVMRLLLDAQSIPPLQSLGFDEQTTNALLGLVGSPYGMIVVTGPTGCGKTTTLHSILKMLDSNEKNIVSIEDPIEYKAEGVAQIQVNEAVGLSFANGLRSILRQDPDVIMVGEIRDEETAKLAVRAALTGHLTLSTLHTNSAVSAISRLKDIGVEEFLIASSVVAVLAQRLVRKLCPHCKKEILAQDTDELFGISASETVFVHVGCEKCKNRGFLGRIAVGEILILDSELRSAIGKKYDENELLTLAIQKGLKPMKQSLKELVLSGQTSLLEAKKALFLNA
jgi:general secretion pathway protein E